MKTGLFTSFALHAAVIGFGLVSLSSPRPLEVVDVEALPVDIVPIEQLTQIQQGDRKAPVAEKPAPTPAKRPDIVEKAENAGTNQVDLKTSPAPQEKPRDIKTASAPPPDPKPDPVQKNDPKPEPLAEKKAEPVPATELKPEPQPKQDVMPDPADKAAVTEKPEAETIKLPDTAPTPLSRPQPPKAQTAKAPVRKDSKIPSPDRKSAAASQTEFNEDEIAALLNRESPSGGGAKQSPDEAALGGKRDTAGTKLSQSEMDALRGQIQRCWNVTFAGAEGADTLKVSIRMRLDPAGEIEGNPEIVAGGGQGALRRIASEAARRAVLRCAPYNLPAEKYDSWSEVLVHFDPSDMF